jgi:hypothetical protein
VVILGYIPKIRKAHFRRLDLHIFVEKPRRSTTAPAFIATICKPIQQTCIFSTLETHPGVYFQNPQSAFNAVSSCIFLLKSLAAAPLRLRFSPQSASRPSKTASSRL